MFFAKKLAYMAINIFWLKIYFLMLNLKVTTFFSLCSQRQRITCSPRWTRICQATDARPSPLHLITAQCQPNKYIYIILIKQGNGNCHPKSQPVCQGQACVCLSVYQSMCREKGGTLEDPSIHPSSHPPATHPATPGGEVVASFSRGGSAANFGVLNDIIRLFCGWRFFVSCPPTVIFNMPHGQVN